MVMTHSGGKPHTNVGDRGQRYEVTYLPTGPVTIRGQTFDPLPTGERKVIGWASNMEGARAFCRAVRAHPTWTMPEIRDREDGNKLVKE